ncbi:diguanylate cyclase, partial [Candidatus Aerophobetes bacterium]|nr:diguanylate cyclase [Candidatus Aerophobetes bacterium]
MSWQYTPYIWPLVISALTSVIIILVAWKRRHIPGSLPLMFIGGCVLQWSLCNVLELGSIELSAKIFWANLQYFGILILPVMWLVFALEYTARDKWLAKRNFILLLIVPAITLILAWTNESHGLIRYNVRLDTAGPFSVVAKEYGAWFKIQIIYSYMLLFVGTLLLLQILLRPPYFYRKQAIILLAGVLTPWVANIMYITGFNPIPRLDITPPVFAVSGLIILWSIYRFELLDMMPLTRDVIFEDMSDGIIVLNALNRILDTNPAVENITGYKSAELIGKVLTDVIQPSSVKLAEYLGGKEKLQVEIVLGEKEKICYYALTVSPLYSRRNIIIGRMVTLRDITKQKHAEIALQESKQKIEGLHEIALRFDTCQTEEEIYRLSILAAEKILKFSTCQFIVREEGKPVIKITLPESATSKQFKSKISLPVSETSTAEVFSVKEDVFAKDSIGLLEILLSHTRENLERVHLQKELKEQAIRDHLTGVYNRRYFSQIINKEIKRARRYNSPIVFLMIDINRFKEINDIFGHQTGDFMLQRVAKMLQEELRETDIIIRYGGDEFLVLLLDVKEDIETLIQRIRNAFSLWNEKEPLVNFPVTLAIGFSY